MADMHFDAPFTVLSNFEEMGELRRLEQRKAFKKIIDYIKNEHIKYLLISGDLYEHKYIRKTTIEYLNNLFQSIPETKIFITPGNHDPFLKNSYYNNYTWSDNVYIFNSKPEKYEFDDVDIYGVGFDDFYCKTSKISNIKIENRDKINILIIHGQLNASETIEMAYNPINENELKALGFDYVALGHVHKQMIDNNIVYPGSAVSMGFDELGEHGALDVLLDKNKLNINFIRLDSTEFIERELNISEINTQEELIEKIENEKYESNKLYKYILVGDKKIEINKNKLLKLLNINNLIKIKDESKYPYDLEELSNQNNLKGYFIKEVQNMKRNNKYSDEKINKIIELGLNALTD